MAQQLQLTNQNCTTQNLKVMKKFILSIFAALAVAFAAEANGRTFASFSAQQGGRFVLTINGERMNGRPANTLNLDHLRPGRNMVHVEFHRNGRILRTRQAIFLSPGHETVFNIRGGRYGASINKVGEYPVRVNNGRRGNNGGGFYDDWNAHNNRQQFKDFMFVLRNERFDDRKFLMAKEFLRGRNINTNQLNRILNQFTFERNKVDFTVKAYGHLVDQQNLPTVFHQFQFRSSIREVRERVNRRYHSQGNTCNTW